jgi:hypothetical protein
MDIGTFLEQWDRKRALRLTEYVEGLVCRMCLESKAALFCDGGLLTKEKVVKKGYKLEDSIFKLVNDRLLVVFALCRECASGFKSWSGLEMALLLLGKIGGKGWDDLKSKK